MKDLNDVTTLDLFDLDAQLRDMFAIHRELFDSQDRERAYAGSRRSNLFRSRMRNAQTPPSHMATLLPDTPYFDCGEVK
tara:strand:+ start:840 stop:1076 length:237 start_codon:yes stop_codon:yes gene_type:complete